MNGKKKGFIIVFLFILALPLIFSAPNAPVNLGFSGNSDSNYDEGVFSVTWNSGGGDPEMSYNIYVFSDEVFLMRGPNSSETGFGVNNPAEAKYTFIVEALNASGFGVNSSGNVSIIVDSTNPSLNIINVVNNVFKKNTETISLNAFISDSDSGMGNCVVSIGGVNTSITSSGGWCNSTSISLAGLSDGNKTINVYASDVAGNVVIDKTYRIGIDTSGPIIDFECLPSSVYVNDEVICNCTATDSGVGFNYTEFSSNPPTSDVGTFVRTCKAFDLLGNYNSVTISYTVSSGAPYTGDNPIDSSTDSNVSWIYTYSINETQFLEGYTQTLAAKRRIKAPIDLEDHSIGVLELNSTHVTLEIASTPVQKILGVGESVNLDILDDGFYDIYILLNGILNNDSANLTVQNIRGGSSIDVNISEKDVNGSLNNSDNQTNVGEDVGFLKGKMNKKKVLIFGGAFLFAVVLFIIIYFLTGKKTPKVPKSKKDEEKIMEDSEEGPEEDETPEEPEEDETPEEPEEDETPEEPEEEVNSDGFSHKDLMDN